MLTPCPGQDTPTKGSRKLILFDCSCGNKNVPKTWKNFISGHTQNCGRCNLLTAEHFSKTKYGKLRMKEPKDTLGGSNKKIWWVCDCGKETLTSACSVTSGRISSCGKCNLLTAEHFSETKYGKLRMKDPEPVHAMSHKTVTWLCDCGTEIKRIIFNVTRGLTKSCGKCNLIPASHFVDNKYGKLKLTVPRDLLPESEKITEWLCDCGKTIKTKTCYVISGDIKNCGRCDVIPKGTSDNKPKVKCPSPANTHFEPSYEPSTDAQKDIASFIGSLGFQTTLEYQLGGWNYDICVPSHNMLIEYHGLHWHSGETSRRRSVDKYKHATRANFDFILIFEDEWVFNEDKVKSLLKNKLEKSTPIGIRPKSCDIELINSKLADRFYNEHHYIGHCKASVNYGVFRDNELISCASFKHPTRQSKYEWELVRMASNPNYRVHGIWSKIMKLFINDHPSPLVSFSDNRLFSGKVYEKLGFKFDGDIPPDYYWCKGNKRFHKSGLRKTEAEKLGGLTETELRTAQGYNKIWDLGKKRWVYKRNMGTINETEEADKE
jgi:hypothetical protein